MESSLKYSDFQVEIFPGNICPGDICPYQEYLSWYGLNFNQTRLKKKDFDFNFLEPDHVTQKILTLKFLDTNFFDPKFFLPKFLFNLNFFNQNFLVPIFVGMF